MEEEKKEGGSTGSEPGTGEEKKETPAPPVETPKPTVDPATEMAALRGMLESFGSKLAAIENAAANPPPGPGQTEAEKVLLERFQADLAALPEAHANAVKEIAGDNAVMGMKVYSALAKAGLFVPKQVTPAAPSDAQNLPAGGSSSAPASWEEATSRIAAGMANPRL